MSKSTFITTNPEKNQTETKNKREKVSGFDTRKAHL
jgi:hypothetical protein